MKRNLYIICIFILFTSCDIFKDDPIESPEPITVKQFNITDEITNSGSLGQSTNCKEGISTNFESLNETLVKYSIEGEQCIPFQTVNSQKKEVEIVVGDELHTGLSLSQFAKVYSGTQTMITFSVTNEHKYPYCSVVAMDASLVDSNGNSLHEKDHYLLQGPIGFIAPDGLTGFTTCIYPNQTLFLSARLSHLPTDLLNVDKFYINHLNGLSDNLTQASNISPNYFSWTENSITVSTSINPEEDLSLNGSSAYFYDHENYLIDIIPLKSETENVSSFQDVIYQSTFTPFNENITYVIITMNWNKLNDEN